ncbi:uncharacterized protein ACB058_017996 isoform 1-T1 [Synchiropus picturatus]
MTELSTVDSFETPYEDDNDFVTCTVCEKSIKGNSLYKIHLTTTSHLKREDELVAQGLLTRDQRVPIFDDILQYLNYLQLGEPIIGLSVVQQTSVGNAESATWPIYTCLMCKQNVNLPAMVTHLIGRKHRQKYIKSNWPDMLRGDLDSSSGTKLIRYKAEIVEQQEGRGCPMPMKNVKYVWKSQHSKAKKRQKLKGNTSFPKFDSAPTQHVDPFQQGRNIPEHSLDQDVPHGFNGDRHEYQREDTLGYSVHQSDWVDEGKADRGSELSDPDFQRLYDKVVLDSPSPVVCKPVLPRYNLRDEPPCGQALYEEYTRGADPDRHKDWFSDNPRHEQDYRSSDLEAPTRYAEAEKQWSSTDIRTTREGQEWRGPTKPVPKSSFSSNVMSSEPRGRVLVKDYYHQMSDSSPNERFENPAPARAPTFHSSMDVKRTLSSIPEPFMRFLEGSEDHKRSRKRGSRFSDATAEEVATAREVYRGDYSSTFDGPLAADRSPNQMEPRPLSSSMLSGRLRASNQAEHREFTSVLSGSFRTETGSNQAEFSPVYSSNIDGPLKRERVPNQTEFRPEYSSLLNGPSRRGSSLDRAEFQSQYSSGSEGPSRKESGLRDFSSDYSSVSEGPSRRGSGFNQTESQSDYSSMLDGPLWRERGPVDGEYRPQSSSVLSGPPPSQRGSFMAESRARHLPVYETDLQGRPPGIRQRQMSGPEAVLDMLDDVEIENADDAKFLKNKLLNILNEYKAKKMERTDQNNRGRNEEYCSPGSRHSQERPYESHVRDDGDMRRSNDLDYRDDQLRGGWRDDYGPAKARLDCRPTESKRPSRRAYEDVFGPAEMYPDELQHMRKRLSGGMESRNCPLAPNEHFHRNAGPPRELDPRGPSSMQYSSNIDKLNSTLMALIRRK